MKITLTLTPHQIDLIDYAVKNVKAGDLTVEGLQAYTQLRGVIQKAIVDHNAKVMEERNKAQEENKEKVAKSEETLAKGE